MNDQLVAGPRCDLRRGDAVLVVRPAGDLRRAGHGGAGSTVEFTATIVDNGPDDADNLRVAAVFPAGIAAPAGYFCDSSDGGCGLQEEHRLDLRGLVMPAGTTQTDRVDVTVPATGFSSIAGTFGVTIDTGSDVDAANDSATATTTITP